MGILFIELFFPGYEAYHLDNCFKRIFPNLNFGQKANLFQDWRNDDFTLECRKTFSTGHT